MEPGYLQSQHAAAELVALGKCWFILFQHPRRVRLRRQISFLWESWLSSARRTRRVCPCHVSRHVMLPSHTIRRDFRPYPFRIVTPPLPLFSLSLSLLPYLTQKQVVARAHV